MLYVIEVVLQLRDGIFDGGAVSFIDLRPARQPGLDLQARPVEGDRLLQFRDELRPLRTRPNHGHVALEDRQHLGKLVEPDPPQEASHARDALVAGDGPAGLVAFFRIAAHRPEFEQPKGTPVQARPPLGVEDGAPRVD